MNIAFEPVMSALLAHLQATTVLPFTAAAGANSPTLTYVSSFAGLFAGLPALGPGVPKGTTIAALDEGASTLTLSNPVTATSAAGAGFQAGFQGWSRRLQHWTLVSAQPAGFLRRIGANDEPDELFETTTLESEVWIYCNIGQDPDVAPDTGLTALEQLVRASFAPDADYAEPRFTLGGLVYWCRVEGRTDSSAGDQGAQAISRMPVRITLP